MTVTRQERLELIRITYGKHGIADMAVEQAKQLEFYLNPTSDAPPAETQAETPRKVGRPRGALGKPKVPSDKGDLPDYLTGAS